jgi:hypothetical protein
VVLLEHHATVESARSLVDPFLHDWEVAAGLQFGPGALTFTFSGASVIDRRPHTVAPRQRTEILADGLQPGDSVVATLRRSAFPSAPESFQASRLVEVLYERFKGYRQGKEPIAAMACYCLTAIERSGGGRADLRTLPEDELLDLRRRAAAEIANRKAHQARNREQAVRKWSELAKEAGVTERELSILFGGESKGEG